MRQLALFIIGLVFGALGGFIAAGGAGDGHAHDHMGHSDGAHDLSGLTDWPADAGDSALTLGLSPDTGRDMNLHIMAPNFRFAPEEVNGPVTPAAGHAHVYVNGEKVGRAYGPYMLLSNIQSGDLIRVTLNANDHSTWGRNGQPVAAEITAP